MTIVHVLEIPDRGRAVMGVNSDLDAYTDDEIRRRIGAQIRFVNGGHDFVESVLDVNITTSPFGGKNIYILIRKGVEVQLQTEVHSVG